MANVIQSRVYRDKYRKATLEQALRNRLVAEKVCQVDRTDNLRIQSPYGSQPTAAVQTIAGTYTISNYTLTDDTLTVTDEVIYAEHIFDFEDVLTNFDVFAARVDETTYAVAQRIDQFVINGLCQDSTATYTTPTGGFTSPVNINIIMSNLISRVSGYAEMYQGMYLIIENTDVVGFVQAQATNGFNYADSALNNGFMGSYMGVDIYVVRTGTYVSSTIGSRTFTNSGKRVFGIKNQATYASPRGVRFDEKAVSLKTGREVVTWAYIGFKLWFTKTALSVTVTLA